MRVFGLRTSKLGVSGLGVGAPGVSKSSTSKLSSTSPSVRKFGWIILGLCLVAFACSDSGSQGERLLDIDASATVCAPRGEQAQTGLLTGTQTKLIVLPGERIRFRVYNNGNELMEFILTDQAGVALRYEKLQPGIRIINPAELALGDLRLAGDLRPTGEFEQAGDLIPAGELGLVRLAPGELATADLAHDGHEDEYGPDATEDYQYRMIIDPQSVRNMLVTFPEATEGYTLNRAICADPDSLDQIVVAEIARR